MPASDRSSHAVIRIQIPVHRGIDSAKRYTDSKGAAVGGLKLRGLQRNYWFPEETRVTRYDRDLLVVAYQALFVYPRKAVKVIDNANDSERDLEAVSVENNPGLIAFMQQFHGTGHGSSGRRSSSSLSDPFASDGWCNVWDPACICPDCLWDPTGGWSEQLQCGLICGGGGGDGSYYTLSNDPAFDCAVAGYADDPDLYASCLAAGGPNGPRDILYSFIRQNARDYVWYAGNLDTVLSTQTNPVAAGAFTYSSFYNGLFDGPYFAQGSFIGDSPSWDFIDIHQYPTASFGFSQSRFTYYGPEGPVGGSLARLAHIRTGSSNLGT